MEAWRGAGVALLVCALAAACHRSPRPTVRTDLSGLTLRLPDVGLKLAGVGHVADTPAAIELDVAMPLSTVTTGCFPAGPPPARATVRVPQPSGGWAELPEVRMPRIRLEDVELLGRRAGLLQAERCALALGSDVLAPYALHVDPFRRELRVSPSRPRDDYLREVAAGPPSEELYLVELSRDPTGDWPLLSVRLRQGEIELTGPFVLSTQTAQSSLAHALAQREGLLSERSQLEAMGLPVEQLGQTGYALDRLELLPGLGFGRARLATARGWSNPGALGELGADVWGRFRATIDVGAGVLVLRRPRVVTANGVQRCMGAERASEEACFELRAGPGREGAVEVATTIWRELPQGGRLYLQLLDGEGRPLPTGCQVGFTFDPSDRGVSAAHRLPWSGLEKGLPACARALAQARGATPGLFEEEPFSECPGDCAFVVHLASRRTRCECLLPGANLSSAERRALQQLRSLHGKRRTPAGTEPPVEPDEPRDPEP